MLVQLEKAVEIYPFFMETVTPIAPTLILGISRFSLSVKGLLFTITTCSFYRRFYPKTKCTTIYQLGIDCHMGLEFVCYQFDFPNSSTKCKSGDRLTVGNKRLVLKLNQTRNI